MTLSIPNKFSLNYFIEKAWRVFDMLRSWRCTSILTNTTSDILLTLRIVLAIFFIDKLQAVLVEIKFPYQ